MADPVRARLYREDHNTNDGRRLERTVWSEAGPEIEGHPYPLLLGWSARDPDTTESGHAGALIVGEVTDLQREDDGWVTGLLHTDHPLTGLACEADFDQADIDNRADIMVMTGARLRAVTLGTRPTWDGMWIE